MKLYYDLHIHSCLSPCGDADMLPSNIVGMAALKGLDVIAVTDHCSCLNCPAVKKLADKYGLIALFGMELTTEEEVHVLCLFAELDNAMKFGEFIRTKYLGIKNKPEIFGSQQVVDENDNIISEEEILLINATAISFDEVFALTEEYNGIMIPAHIDKNSNSLISNLGFIPVDSKFTCVELKHSENYNELCKKHSYLKNCRVISSSDAHYLEYINEPVNYIETAERTAESVIKALKYNK